MFTYAQILNGKVHNIMQHEANISELYEKYYARTIEFVDITYLTKKPSVGMLYNGFDFYDEVVVIQMEVLVQNKLIEIDKLVAKHITSGFTSTAMGESFTYDSDQVDQENMKLMHQASLDPTFDTDPTYQGRVPIRAIPAGETAKVILMHDKNQLQTLISDLARHIGRCKVRGWQLQAAVAAATTQAEIEAIQWDT